MTAWLRKFQKSEDGAVTVDWVVLTAAICVMGIAVIAIVSDGATDSANGLGARLSSITVN